MAVGAADEPRVFTIEEANALLPRLTELVGAQLDLGEQIQTLVSELWELAGPSDPSTTDVPLGGEVIDITIAASDTPKVKDLKGCLGKIVERYREGWKEVNETGVIVKDTRLGLLDFYGRVDDRIVWLCWKYGEPSIDWYHELHVGFSGRKSLAAARKRMLN
jgi:hypothetical protein